jgi:hypothetical protein
LRQLVLEKHPLATDGAALEDGEAQSHNGMG